MEPKENKIKYKIGVMGTAGRGKQLPEELLNKAREIGREIASNNCILITGACMGVSHEAAIGAGEEGGLSVGISPSANLKEHTEPPMSYPAPPKNMIHIYTGFGREGWNVIAVRSCDAVIFIAGHSGTLNEFSVAYQLGKVIGILEGVGGISERIQEIANLIQKETGAVLVSDSDSENLVKKVIKEIEKRK